MNILKIWFQVPYNENLKILDTEILTAATTCYTLPPGIYKTSDIHLIKLSLLPNKLKMNVTFDYIRLSTNLAIRRTLRFTNRKISFQHHTWTQTNFILLRGYYSEKPREIATIDKTPLNCDSIVVYLSMKFCFY